MSTLNVGTIQGLPDNANIITIPNGHTLYAPGMVAQVRYFRSDTRTTYSSLNTGNGTPVTELNLTITPRFSNSLLLMQWMINGELHQDNAFVIHRDGALITTSGATGFNSAVGNVRQSGFANAFYDQNEDSTPSNWFLQYAVTAGSTAPTTFVPAVRGTGATSYTFALNRVIANASQDNYESMVSTGTIWEIMQ